MCCVIRTLFCDSLVVVVVEEVRRVRGGKPAGLGLPAGPDVGLDVRVASYDCGRARRGIRGEGRGRAEREREDGLGHRCRPARTVLSGCRVAARRRARAVSSARRRARAVSSTEQLGRASRAFLLLQTPSVHASRARCARMHECADRCLLDAAGDASCRALRPWMPATPQSTTANESPPGTVARPGDASGHCSLAPGILPLRALAC